MIEQIDHIDRSSRSNRTEGGLRIRGAFCKKSTSAKPLVTVITVVRNGKEHIESSIQSVLGQTYENIEYIVIDGASTDGTIDIINKYDHMITYWLSEPDAGIYDAMNKGIDLATGDWLNFMNSGDTFYETDTINNVLLQRPSDVDVIYGHHNIIYNKNLTKVRRAKNVNQIRKGVIFCHQSSFVKADLMKKYKFNLKNRIAADFEFYYVLYLNKGKFHNSQIIISSILADGLSGVDTVSTIRDQWRAVRKYSNNLKINIFFIFNLLYTYLKNIIKALLPQKLRNYLRARL